MNDVTGQVNHSRYGYTLRKFVAGERGMSKKISVRQGCKMLSDLYERKNELNQMALKTNSNSLMAKKIDVEKKQVKSQIHRLKINLNSLYPDVVFNTTTCKEIMANYSN